MTLHMIGKGLPDNISEIQVNSDHLLSTVSPAALNRADGWEKGAHVIDDTRTDFEEVMAA